MYRLLLRNFSQAAESESTPAACSSPANMPAYITLQGRTMESEGLNRDDHGPCAETVKFQEFGLKVHFFAFVTAISFLAFDFF